MGHHRSVQLLDGLAARLNKQERQQRVDKTGTCPHQHLAREPGGAQQVLPIGLTDRGRVFVEEPLNIHAQQRSGFGALQCCEHQGIQGPLRNKVARYSLFR